MPKKEDETPTPAASKGKKILIVEDEKPLAHALKLKLSHEGFDVTVTFTGADGLEEAKKGSYAAILLDLIMPGMDGFAVLEDLSAKKITTPIIVLSNLGQDEDKTKAKALGAKDYFVKANTPIADIVKHIKSFL